MFHTIKFVFCILSLLIAWTVKVHGEPVGSAFTYQGKLSHNGSPPVSLTADFRFRLFDADVDGKQFGSELEAMDVQLSTDGTFTVDLDFGVKPFAGVKRWLDIDVRSPHDPSDIEPFETLSPRQPIMPTPYALFALNAPVTWIDKGNGDIAYTDGNIGIGTSPPTQALHVGGNVRADGWIGTDVDAPVTFRVNNTPALRFEYAMIDYETRVAASLNVIAGSECNSVAPGVAGATISGGGLDDGINMVSNQVTADFGTVGGGAYNRAHGRISTIGGGEANTASGSNSTIGGGISNRATGSGSVIGGGQSNTASGFQSTVGGGYANTASGIRSTVPGGIFNQAGGRWSFAAGYLAKVRDANEVGDSDGDAGTFVWSDSTAELPNYFASTGPNQFLVNATGGVGLGTNAPKSQLHVAGSMSKAITTVTQDLTLDFSHNVVIVDASLADVTVTLPWAVSCEGRVYTIKRKDPMTTLVTLNAKGSETIDELASHLLANKYHFLTVISDGSNWFIIGRN